MKTKKKKEKTIQLTLTLPAASYLQAALETAMSWEIDPVFRDEYQKIWSDLTVKIEY